jgi:AcrR family transcriptional regulator
MSQPPTTRTRIQQVAVDLFTEQGYDATSLREIAERLGVTKAALYYHFKSKEEIVQSLVEDQIRMVEDLIAWAREQPRTLQTRREIIRRYGLGLEAHRGFKLMRLLDRNQTSLQKSEAGSHMRTCMLDLLDQLSDPDTTPANRVRRSLAMVAMHAGFMALRDQDLSDEQRRAAAMEVAMELVE